MSSTTERCRHPRQPDKQRRGSTYQTGERCSDNRNHFYVTVSDIDRAVSFYRDVLGLEFLFQVPDKPMAFFKDPDENVLAVMEERGV